MDTLFQDVRFALRGFAKNRGFTVVALLSLTLGIGVNTAVFSVANAVLLRPLPYPGADRLVILWNRSPGLNITQDWFSTAQYFDIKNASTSFEQIAIAIGANYNLTGFQEPERIGAVRASSNLLPMFGASAALGRLLNTQDDSPGRSGAAVLTYGAWARRYGSDVHAIGKSMVLNGRPFEIVGVLPRGFALPREVLPTLYGASEPDLFLPLPLDSSAVNVRTHEDYNIVATLKRSATPQTAQAEMDIITARLRREHPGIYPPNGGLTFGVVPLFEQVIGDVRQPLGILLASVSLVLLIACSNVANLLLSRASGRKQEILVRAAIGASSARLVRQLLTESLLLALGGGALGVALAQSIIQALRTLGPGSVPRVGNIDIDLRVLLFTMFLSLCAGIVFGLAPALRLARFDLRDGLQSAGRGTAGSGSLWARRNHLRRFLVVLEAALSVMLLIGAGLLIRSFERVQSVPAGFDPKNTLTLGLTMSGRKYDNRATVQHAYQSLWDELERLPGVSAAGGVSALPLSELFSWGPITVEGRISAAGENFINADQRTVAAGYFQAMHIPLLKGRLFNKQDIDGAPPVVVIDDNMARQLWPNENPIGKRIRYGGISDKFPWQTVVGIVGRVKQYALDSDSRIAFYTPHAQQPTRAMTVVIKAGASPAALTSSVKQAISRLDPDLPIFEVRTMENRVDESLARRRFSMSLLGLFAALALALSAIGMYGVMAYLVNQSVKEIGIRMALGATQLNIGRMVLSAGFGLAAFGAVLGIAGAAVLTRFMRNLLFGVQPIDPLTFLAVPVMLTVIAITATYFPARRAWRIEPMAALRSE
jgi:putative ABC transport system permease protein